MVLQKVEPETIYLDPTPHVPNSRLPVIVYRGALSEPSPDDILATIEPNNWLKGGQWNRSVETHFHSVTHECYGIVKGSSTYVLGKSPIDGDEIKAYELDVKHGDVFVLPAGVSHTSINHKDDYEFIGLYPQGGPIVDGNPWDMNWAKDSPETTKEIADRAARVAIPPLDPLYGADGPLPRLWREAAARTGSP